MARCELVVGRPWNAARRWRNVNSWLQEPWNGETRTCCCKDLEIKYPTPLQPFCEPAFVATHYPRPPCAPSFIKSRTLRIYILPTHFLLFWNSLYVYMRGILGYLLGFWPLGQNSAGAMKEGECDSFACAPTCMANMFSTVQITVQYRCIFVLLFGRYSLKLDNNSGIF